MKIIQLVESLDIGGLPNYVLQLANLQQNAGHSVDVAYVKGEPGAHLETDDLNISNIKNIQDLIVLSPDIVHIHLLSDIDFLKDLHKSDLTIIRSFHDYTSTCLRRGKRRFPGDRCHRSLNYGCAAFGCIIGPPLPDAKSRRPRLMNLSEKIHERNIYRGFNAAICGSYHMRNMLLSNGFDEHKTHRILYFSKFADEAENTAEKEDGAGTTRPVKLLFSGQAVKGKGLEVLIEALGMDNIKNENWHLTVFTEGPRKHLAIEQAKSLGIVDKITFNGWVEQSKLRNAYREADAFILPSIWDDPGPLVGIEALACGTPVIGFAVGGIPDYVIEGETGYLVKDISAQGLSKTIQTALNDAPLLKDYAPKCKRHVRNNHSAQGHLDNIQKVYDQITG